ncbi:septal ring lytic transglycosylase RlpA family protein [Algiphilus sp.]|uniref:septal ring lytic transglycosylase RlpA family protein n=1 Tax=Algiphilus sp. TaxID=1872431 RepID=UPI003B5237AE
MTKQFTRALLCSALLLGGCAHSPAPQGQDDFLREGPAPAHEKDRGPAAHEVPDGIATVPDAQVRPEAKSRYGNPDSYEVFGKRYYVLPTAAGYRERGGASWYGKKFHGRRTSSGEPYDMYAMTAAHKTLPLPSFVRVTHLGNGRSAVVRVNDRGPFHEGRIIDLSYAAAARLDIISDGHAEVEVEALTTPAPLPDEVAVEQPSPATTEAAMTRAPSRGSTDNAFVAVGAATEDPVHAVELRERLLAMGLDKVTIHLVTDGERARHEVRVGPLESRREAEDIRLWLAERALMARTIPATP